MIETKGRGGRRWWWGVMGEHEVVLVTPENFFDDDGQPKDLFMQLKSIFRIGVIDSCC